MDSRFDNLFLHARELTSPAGREAFLDEACAGDPELRQRLEAKLISEAEAAAFFGEAVTRIDPGAQAAVPGEEPGTFIGPFKLLQQIGEGGFGTVWMADQQAPVRRRVALKIIKPGLDTKEVIARFEQERQALAMMDHPNIAKVFDAGVAQSGRPYFVMELVRGTRITHYCDQANLPTAERLQLFIAVCRAVQHAHQKGIIHRDLKPSNILVTLHDGVPAPKVIDFGVAKAIQQERLTELTLHTQFAQMIGTPLYMSPEQAEMSGLDIDTRSDIYSLGVLLYELLTGRTPFDMETLMRAGLDEMRRVIREQEPPKPSTALSTMAVDVRANVAQSRQTDAAKMASQLRGDLDWVVMKALEKDRTRRYETANGFAQDIRRFLANEPVTAAAPGVGYLFRKFARRNKAALGVAALILIVLVAATGISLWQTRLAKQAAAEALTAKKEATAKAADERAAREDAEAITKFLVGVFQSPEPGNDGRKVTVVETLQTAVKRLDTDLSSDVPMQAARRAQLQYTLGRTYQTLDLAREAIPLLEASRAYFLAALGANDRFTLSLTSQLAFAYDRAGRLTEALQLQEQVLERSRKVYAPEDPGMLEALDSLAKSCAAVDRLDDAIKLFEEAERISIASGAKHRAVTAVSNLANAYRVAGRKEDALRLGKKALSMSREVNGEKHAITLTAMNTLAASYSANGNRGEALALLAKAAELMDEVVGPTHTSTLTVMNNLAVAYEDSGDLAKALEIRQKVLNSRSKKYGDDHPETLMAMTALAVSFAKMRRFPEAIELQEKALTNMRTVLPPRHEYLVFAVKTMSYIYRRSGKIDEARTLDLELEALKGEGVLPATPPSPAVNPPAATAAPAAPATPGKPAAVKPLEEALEKLRKAKDPKPAEMIAAMTELARAYGADGSGRKAITLGEEALKLAQRLLPPGDEHTIHAMKALIPLYKSVDLNDEARKLEAGLQSLTEKKQK